MPFGGLLTGASIAAPIIGGLIGGKQTSDAMNAATDQQRAQLAALQGIALPDIEQQKLILALQQQVGQYNPNLENALHLGPTAMEGVNVNPEYAQAQHTALQSLQDIGKTGLTAAEKAQLDLAMRGVAQQEQSREAGIMQNLAQRGIAGSGLELAQKMKSSQNAADLANQQAAQTMAMAQQRALQAISQSGALGGQIRSQEFGEQSDVAKAKDIINAFNTQNTQNVQQRNVGNQNTAQLTNLQNAQNIANQNVATQNQQQTANKALLQQQFQNQLSKVTGAQPTVNNISNLIANQGAQTGKMYGDVATGISKGITAVGQNMNTPQTLPSNATNYLDALKRGVASGSGSD